MSGNIGSRSAISPATLWWFLISVTALFTALHLGHVLNYLFPLMILGMALAFEKNSPKNYVRLVVLALMFTPFVRRLADYAGEYTEMSPILTAPLLAPFVGLRSIRFGRLLRREMLPLTLALLGLLYGLLVALATRPEAAMYSSFLRWSGPVLLGMYLIERRDMGPELVSNFLRVLKWSALAAGLYGVVQIVVLPPWDRNWLKMMLDTGMGNSFGHPEPFDFRCFSTLNSCGVASFMLAIGMLVWFASKSKWRFLAFPTLSACIFLTLVRTEWICLPLSIVLLFLMAPKLRTGIVIGLTVAVGVLAAGVLLAATVRPELSAKVLDRFKTMGDGSRDQSLGSRSTAINAGLGMLPGIPFGKGIGFMDGKEYDRTPMANPSNATGNDLGLLGMPFELGLLGTVAYLTGVGMSFVAMARHKATDPTPKALLITIAATVVLHCWSIESFSSPPAFFFWASVALVGAL